MTNTHNITSASKPPLKQRIKQKYEDHKSDIAFAGWSGVALMATYILGRERSRQTIKVDLFRVIPDENGGLTNAKVEHEQRFPDIPVQ